MSENKKNVKWYDNGHIVTTLIIIVIACTMLSSQSFAIGGTLSLDLLWSVINHNSHYIVLLLYFILVKFKIGKQYFNYLNIYLLFVYLITTVTSLLIVIQAFTPNALLTCILNIAFVIYLVHTVFRDTYVWQEFSLNNSPFNEIKNDNLFYAVIIIMLINFAVDLIGTVSINGVLLSVLDACFYGLFARYLYLYREYLDYHKIDSNNEGNFSMVQEKVQEVLDKTDIDEKIMEFGDKIVDAVNGVTSEKKNDDNEDSLKEEEEKQEEVVDEDITVEVKEEIDNDKKEEVIEKEVKVKRTYKKKKSDNEEVLENKDKKPRKRKTVKEDE